MMASLLEKQTLVAVLLLCSGHLHLAWEICPHLHGGVSGVSGMVTVFWPLLDKPLMGFHSLILISIHKLCRFLFFLITCLLLFDCLNSSWFISVHVQFFHKIKYKIGLLVSSRSTVLTSWCFCLKVSYMYVYFCHFVFQICTNSHFLVTCACLKCW